MSANSFWGKPPFPPIPVLLDFYLWRHLKTPVYIQLQFKIKRFFTSPFFMPVKSFATTWGPLKVCSSPWSDMSMCAPTSAEDTLSIFFLSCDLINNKNSTVSKLETYKCIMSVVSKILHSQNIDCWINLSDKLINHSLPGRCVCVCF